MKQRAAAGQQKPANGQLCLNYLSHPRGQVQMKFYQFALAGLTGAFVLAALFYFAAYDQAARIDGAIKEVRTLAMDQNASVAIVDFEGANTSDILFVVDDREIIVVDENGIPYEGSTISAFDLKQLFKFFTGLGEMKNEPLISSTKLAPGDTVQGVIAARFEISKDRIDARRELILRVTDVDGGVSEFSLEAEMEPE